MNTKLNKIQHSLFILKHACTRATSMTTWSVADMKTMKEQTNGNHFKVEWDQQCHSEASLEHLPVVLQRLEALQLELLPEPLDEIVSTLVDVLRRRALARCAAAAPCPVDDRRRSRLAGLDWSPARSVARLFRLHCCVVRGHFLRRRRHWSDLLVLSVSLRVRERWAMVWSFYKVSSREQRGALFRHWKRLWARNNLDRDVQVQDWGLLIVF